MRILPNFIYKFTFIANFNSLDGIYKVLRIDSYSTLLGDGIDLFAVLYEPNSLNVTAFENDLPTIRDNRIFKLVDVADENNIVYIPEHILNSVPDASIQKYIKLGISCNIGIHEDPDAVTTLKSEIEQHIEAMIGETNNALIFKISDEYLTASEYASIEATRAANITTVSNSFTDKAALQLEVDRLRTKIIYYEDLIKSL